MDLGWPTWIGVVVEDFDGQRVFYRDILRLRELRAGEDFVWFEFGDGRLLDVLRRSDDDPTSARTGFQVGFAVEDVEAAREELLGCGVEPVGGILGGPKAGSRWACFRDAEGNVFQVTQHLEPPSV